MKNNIQNRFQITLNDDIKPIDEITCKQYWITDDNEKNYCVWEFPHGYAVVPEGGMIGRTGTEVFSK